jgi:hypothetical protein
MITPTAKKFLGAVLAAITLTMVTSVAPAAAVDKDTVRSIGFSTQYDSGWGGVKP